MDICGLEMSVWMAHYRAGNARALKKKKKNLRQTIFDDESNARKYVPIAMPT